MIDAKEMKAKVQGLIAELPEGIRYLCLNSLLQNNNKLSIGEFWNYMKKGGNYIQNSKRRALLG